LHKALVKIEETVKQSPSCNTGKTSKAVVEISKVVIAVLQKIDLWFVLNCDHLGRYLNQRYFGGFQHHHQTATTSAAAAAAAATPSIISK
jgi:hypothetical protein